jgi:hypothetical protein
MTNFFFLRLTQNCVWLETKREQKGIASSFAILSLNHTELLLVVISVLLRLNSKVAATNFEIVPSLSMVYVSSPCGVGWLYRLVYFPDQKSYDLIPEHFFMPTIPNHMVAEIWQRYHGAVVQPFCIGGPQDGDTDKGNTGTTCLDSTRMGVRIVTMETTGHGDWWTVRRIDDHQVGVQEIVL